MVVIDIKRPACTTSNCHSLDPSFEATLLSLGLQDLVIAENRTRLHILLTGAERTLYCQYSGSCLHADNLFYSMMLHEISLYAGIKTSGRRARP